MTTADVDPGALAALDDADLAAAVAAQAGELLLALRADHGGGDGDAALGAEGDRRADRLILELLAAARPGDPVLSEESADQPARLSSSRVWVVDPLDGTREYREGRWDWAVHIALVVDQVASVGAVAMPAREMVLRSSPAPALAPPGNGPTRLVVSRSRPPAVTYALEAALGADLVPMGSAGAKTMAVVLGEADVYAHAGGQYEWDSAAPVAVAAAAGLHVSRLDGSPLVYNRPDPWLPDLLVCRPELAETVLAVVARDGVA